MQQERTSKLTRVKQVTERKGAISKVVCRIPAGKLGSYRLEQLRNAICFIWYKNVVKLSSHRKPK